MEITNVTRETHSEPGKPDYHFLALPCSKDPPADAEEILIITLQEPLTENHLHLPYNGGIPGQQISIKYD